MSLLLLAVLLGAGLIYFLKPKSGSDISEAAAAKEVVLPRNSWYNESWWSYVSSSPSVRQILEKNKQANGPTPSFEIARTFSLSGKISRATGTCFEQACLDEAERRMYERQRSAPSGFRIPAHTIKKLAAEKKPETSDKSISSVFQSSAGSSYW